MLKIGQVDWQYTAASDYSENLMISRAADALRYLIGLPIDTALSEASDARALHQAYFQGLTPSEMPYFAGNYRGADFGALRDYEVSVGGFTCRPASYVSDSMAFYRRRLAQRMSELAAAWEISDTVFPRTDKIYRLVENAVDLFVDFVSIHPFADGNGHMSRLLLFVIFRRFGLRLRLAIHPNLQRPQMGQFIAMYRRGHRVPLINYMITLLSQ